VALEDDQRLHGLTVLTRLAQREPEKLPWLVRLITASPETLLRPAVEVAVETGEPMGMAVAMALEQIPADSETLDQLIAELPLYPHVLSSLVLLLHARRLTVLSTDKPASLVPRAKALIQFADTLNDIGRWDEALPYAQEAVTILREHDETNNAMDAALRVLSMAQQHSGDEQGAVESAAERLQLFEPSSDSASQAEFAERLSSLANRQAAAGMAAEAEESSTRAIELLRTVLDSLGPGLEHAFYEAQRSGRRLHIVHPSGPEEAAGWGKYMIVVRDRDGNLLDEPRIENVHVMDMLEERPSFVRFGLANALHIRAALRASASRTADALTDALEALRLLHELVEGNTDGSDWLLCLVLVEIVDCYTALGDEKEGEGYASQLVDALLKYPLDGFSPIWSLLGRLIEMRLAERLMRAKLAAAAGTRDRATLHAHLFFILDRDSNADEALAEGQRAVAEYRQLPLEEGGADLLSLLFTLDTKLSELNRYSEACSSLEEAARIARILIDKDPPHFRRALAQSLGNLNDRLRSAQRPAESIAANGEEWVQVLRQLYVEEETEIKPFLAIALAELGVSLSNAGRNEESIAPSEEAVLLLRELVASDPATYEVKLGNALTNLGNRLSQAGRVPEALGPAEEAVALLRKAVASGESGSLHNFAMALQNYSNRLWDLGRTTEALAPMNEAVDILDHLARIDQERHLLTYALSLRIFVIRLHECEDERALELSQELVDLAAQLADFDRMAYGTSLVRELILYARIRLTFDIDLDYAWAAVEEADRVATALVDELPEEDHTIEDLWLDLMECAADVMERTERPEEAHALRNRIADIRTRLAAFDEMTGSHDVCTQDGAPPI
jgi:tetratricopeptide (TPR) repeat protein